MFQCVMYAVADVQLGSSDFFITLVTKTTIASFYPFHFSAHTSRPSQTYQEIASTLRTVGITRIIWHRFMRAINRHTPLDHPFSSEHAIERRIHFPVADSAAEIMGAVAMYVLSLH
jgi:hypothetical protein